MEISVNLPGGSRVDAELKNFCIKTDQPASMGGEGSAPTPFELFLASIATCAGYYVLAFCRERDIPTERIRLIEKVERDVTSKRLEKVSIEILLPADFPKKYRGALVKVAEQCAVKKAIADQPVFEISTSEC